METVDFLIIGSGIAGLSLAIKIADQFPNKKIFIITKGDEDESNTKYAQGGVAAVFNFEKDSFAKHIEDTLDANIPRGAAALGAAIQEYRQHIAFFRKA